jgi:hypothetical protein
MKRWTKRIIVAVLVAVAAVSFLAANGTLFEEKLPASKAAGGTALFITVQ